MRPFAVELLSSPLPFAAPSPKRNLRYLLGYNSRLDGLRGLASICVVSYHYGIPGFKAGLYGLDVFFVLSGYLITKVVLKAVSDGHSLGKFYWNRFLRLMPALAELCLAVLILSFLWPSLVNPQIARSDILSSILYIANWTRAFSLGAPTYLANCWSLAVEEQFYVLWPFLCVYLACKKQSFVLEITAVLLVCAIACGRSGWRRIRSLTTAPLTDSTPAAAACCSAVASALIRTKSYGEPLERLLSRFWPLALLALAALVACGEDHWYAAFGLIGAGVAAVILIAAAYHAPRSLAGRLMDMRPAVFVGKISYSLYLWHYPIMLVLYFQHLSKDRDRDRIGLPVSIAAGFLSYWFVEQPALRLRDIREPAKTQAWVRCGLLLNDRDVRGRRLPFPRPRLELFFVRPPTGDLRRAKLASGLGSVEIHRELMRKVAAVR